MATANVELCGFAALGGGAGTAIYGRCSRSEDLAVSGSTVTLATAVSQAEANAGVNIARVSTDTACYVAVGGTPDPTIETATPASSARALVQAGMDMPFLIGVGEKVAVKALA